MTKGRTEEGKSSVNGITTTYHDLVRICLPSLPPNLWKAGVGMDPLSVPSARQGMGWAQGSPDLLQPTLNPFPGTVVLNVAVPLNQFRT